MSRLKVFFLTEIIAKFFFFFYEAFKCYLKDL